MRGRHELRPEIWTRLCVQSALLAAVLVLRWQMCEHDALAGEDLPFSAAWTRAQLLHQVVTEFYNATEVGRVAGLQGPGEVAGIAALRDAARAHVDAKVRNMLTQS